MPNMDGFECTEKIENLIKEKKILYVPIVAITANIVTADIDKCFNAGMKAYLPKPFTFLQLRKVMDDFLKIEPITIMQQKS